MHTLYGMVHLLSDVCTQMLVMWAMEATYTVVEHGMHVHREFGLQRKQSRALPGES